MLFFASAQHQFQRWYGNNYSIINAYGIQNTPGQTTLLFRLGGCFDLNWNPHCTSIGFMILNNSDSITSCVNIHSSNNDTSYSMQNFFKMNTGNLITVGNSNQNGNFFYSTAIILDTDFNFINGKSYKYGGINQFTKVKQLNNLNQYYVSGTIDSLFHSGTSNILLSRLDSTLMPVWSKIISTNFSPELYDFNFTNECDILATGDVSDSSVGPIHTILMKIDTTGVVKWCKKISANAHSISGHNILVLPDGCILYGTAYDSVFNQHCPYLMKLDTTGNIVWVKKYVCNAASFNGMFQTHEGGFLLSSLYQYAGEPAACLIKTDSAGHVLWNYYYENGSFNQYHSQDEYGGYFSYGTKEFPSGSSWPDRYVLFLMKIDSLGSTGCSEVPFPITISTVNNFIVTNQIVHTSDYMPYFYSFTLKRDTFELNQVNICDGFSSVKYTNFNKLDISIFPNPTIDYLNISWDKPITGNSEIYIIDIFGKEIQHVNVEFANENFYNFSLENIKTGYYFICLKSKEDFYCNKFIKQ
jgi:hypothetical protein